MSDMEKNSENRHATTNPSMSISQTDIEQWVIIQTRLFSIQYLIAAEKYTTINFNKDQASVLGFNQLVILF